MADFFEIDFLDVESDKSGDAITLRYEINGVPYVHVVDAGYQASGPSVAAHIRDYYGASTYIDHVVATHHDGDHAGGLRTILSEFDVGCLWMLRPWLYAAEIIDRFDKFSNVENLARALRAAYPNFAALEEIALSRGIQILEPFQGAQIGAFTVLAPSKTRFLDLVVESEKTPSIVEDFATALAKAEAAIGSVVSRALELFHADWGVEIFSSEPISAENRMSVVQYANICGKKIVLTADAGIDGLDEAANYAPFVGLILPGVDKFQVPHHGSRRNVSTDVLDRWLGERLPYQLPVGSELFQAYISSAKKDEAHPRRSVVRSMHHRGGRVFATESSTISTMSGMAPSRQGWSAVTPLPYPYEQEVG